MSSLLNIIWLVFSHMPSLKVKKQKHECIHAFMQRYFYIIFNRVSCLLVYLNIIESIEVICFKLSSVKYWSHNWLAIFMTEWSNVKWTLMFVVRWPMNNFRSTYSDNSCSKKLSLKVQFWQILKTWHYVSSQSTISLENVKFWVKILTSPTKKLHNLNYMVPK